LLLTGHIARLNFSRDRACGIDSVRPGYVRLPEKFLWRIRKEPHGKKEKVLIDPAINDLIHRPQVIGKLGSLSSSGGHAE